MAACSSTELAIMSPSGLARVAVSENSASGKIREKNGNWCQPQWISDDSFVAVYCPQSHRNLGSKFFNTRSTAIYQLTVCFFLFFTLFFFYVYSIVTHCNILLPIVMCYYRLYTATSCYVLLHTDTYCYWLMHTVTHYYALFFTYYSLLCFVTGRKTDYD